MLHRSPSYHFRPRSHLSHGCVKSPDEKTTADPISALRTIPTTIAQFPPISPPQDPDSLFHAVSNKLMRSVHLCNVTRRQSTSQTHAIPYSELFQHFQLIFSSGCGAFAFITNAFEPIVAISTPLHFTRSSLFHSIILSFYHSL